MNEQKIFHNVKELLDSCVQKLNEKDIGKTGGNVALHPTVLVFVGNKSKKYVQNVKKILDDNWNNTRFLQYLHVVKQDEKWSCNTISTDVSHQGITWESLCSECGQGMDEAILKMLETDERIFADKSRIKMEFILDSTEEYGKEYYDLIMEIGNSFHAENLKTLFLMIDQRYGLDRVVRSENLLRYIIGREMDNGQAQNRKLGTTYLISNYLESGDILGDSKLYLNYRLVANIILLGGNRNSDSHYVTNLYNGIKTVAYALVTKPTNAIAAVSLVELLKQMYENDKRQLERELSEKDIKERMGIESSNGFAFAEEWFRKEIQENLPESNALQYLPFESEKAFREIQNMDSISSDLVDDYTYGAWSAFLQKQYIGVLRKNWQEDVEYRIIRAKIRSIIQWAFSYFELLKLANKKEEVYQIIRMPYQYGGTGNKGGFSDKLQKIALYEVKKSFYEKLKELIVEEFDFLFDAARRFQSDYQMCIEEIERESVVLYSEIETTSMDNIRSVYSDQVKRYIEHNKKDNATESAFPGIFNITGNKEDILRETWNVFLELIDNDIYSYDFEHEVDFRMNSMNEIKRKNFTDELQKVLNGSIRLKSIINVPMKKSICFYMVNANANYAKELAEADGYGKEYMLFGLNRTDCVEQIEIHNITNPENLHVYMQE